MGEMGGNWKEVRGVNGRELGVKVILGGRELGVKVILAGRELGVKVILGENWE